MPVQGLLECEVVLAFPEIESCTAVLMRDPYFVKIIKTWFDARLTSQNRDLSVAS